MLILLYGQMMKQMLLIDPTPDITTWFILLVLGVLSSEQDHPTCSILFNMKPLQMEPLFQVSVLRKQHSVGDKRRIFYIHLLSSIPGSPTPYVVES